MKSSSSGNIHFIKIDKGEEVLQVLTSYIDSNKIRSGSVSAVGAIEDVELGYFDTDKKQYIKKIFKGDHELLSCMGNVGELNGSKHPHVHVIISGPDFACYGGHLLKAKVAVTCEVFITTSSMDLERIYNEEVKLNLLSPKP